MSYAFSHLALLVISLLPKAVVVQSRACGSAPRRHNRRSLVTNRIFRQTQFNTAESAEDVLASTHGENLLRTILIKEPRRSYSSTVC
jgi:hypothetical protein